MPVYISFHHPSKLPKTNWGLFLKPLIAPKMKWTLVPYQVSRYHVTPCLIPHPITFIPPSPEPASVCLIITEKRYKSFYLMQGRRRKSIHHKNYDDLLYGSLLSKHTYSISSLPTISSNPPCKFFTFFLICSIGRGLPVYHLVHNNSARPYHFFSFILHHCSLYNSTIVIYCTIVFSSTC